MPDSRGAAMPSITCAKVKQKTQEHIAGGTKGFDWL
jgi:hypothetical protein